jgi:hypothetical protein
MQTKDIKSYSLNGDFQVEGLQLLYDPASPGDYWNDLDDEFEDSVTHETLESNYTTTRPLKMNSSISYGFGRPYYDDCRYQIQRESYNNKLGVHLFGLVGSLHSYFSGTLFYEKRLSQNFHAKLTYTIDPFSWTNLGIGVATFWGPFNAYVTADNLLHVGNVYDARSMSLSLGFNLVFNH